MKFRTEYIPKRSDITLSPEIPAVLLGSCFSENIASKMREGLWDAFNPCGTLYNPFSIATAIRTMLLSLFPDKEFEKSLFLAEDKYRSWFFDSSFSAWSAVDSMAKFRHNRERFGDMLAAGSPLIVTFGTSWVYRLNSSPTNFVVGNCHKQPENLFTRERISVESIVKEWVELISTLRKSFKKLNVIFTVSPVRHLKDGFNGNSLSKSVLLLAVEQLCRQLDNCIYFPAFEIINDDLRDYRFYASDLCHPSSEAVEYIWTKFRETFFDARATEIFEKGLKINRSLSHLPIPDASVLIPGSVSQKELQRKESLLAEYFDLKSLYPGLISLPGY